MRKAMYTLNRIPSYNLALHYVYFNDLLYDNPRASAKTNEKKKALHAAALADVEKGINILENGEEGISAIKQAMQFVSQVAASERQKEIAFAKYVLKEFPNLKDLNDRVFGMTEQDILDDPMSFYTALTDLLNHGRQGLQQYKDALLRLKDNVRTFSDPALQDAGQHAKPSRHEYSEDDFIYNLEGDLRSFINNIIGRSVNHNMSQEQDSFASKMREAVLKIMSSSKITKKIKAATDFAAISAAIYTELYSQIQHEYYQLRKSQKDLKVTDMAIDKITDKYIEKLKEQDEKQKTTVQRALTGGIRSQDYKLLTANVIDILGIGLLEDQKAINEQIEAIANTDYYLDWQHKGREIDRKNISTIRKMLKSGARDLTQEAQRLHIRKFGENVAQGNMLELVTTIGTDIFSGKGRSIAVGESGKAQDAVSFILEIEEDSPTIDAYTKVLLEKLQKLYVDEGIQNNQGIAHRKKLQEQRTKKILALNKGIDDALKKIDKQMEACDDKKLQHMFIFHESLKEYSSMETGKNTKFGGRTLNILSAWDEVYTAMLGAGIADPALDKDLITLLSLNLANAGGEDDKNVGAVAKDAKVPLTKYLSIFAGLIMFDDAFNMARESINNLTYNNITQLHVYKLNRVYVPASLILFHIEQAIKECVNVLEGMGAQATIDINGANKVIQEWIDKRINDPKNNGHYKYYHIGDWREVASKVASSTKVKITFMASFIKFIEQLLLQDQI